MKYVYLIRHAKSDWDDPTLSDHDRPLNKRGLKDAPMMADLLKKNEIKPDAIFTSTAVRAFTTAEIFLERFPDAHFAALPELYHASEKTIRDFITYTDNSFNTIFIFAHNPGLLYFCDMYEEFSLSNLPTTGIVGIEADIDDWIKFSVKNSSVVIEEYPKKYKQN